MCQGLFFNQQQQLVDEISCTLLLQQSATYSEIWRHLLFRSRIGRRRRGVCPSMYIHALLEDPYHVSPFHQEILAVACRNFAVALDCVKLFDPQRK